MEITGATPFYDISDYRASADGSHVLIKGWLGSKEDYLAVKAEDVLFLMMGLASAATQAKEAFDPQPGVIPCIPLADFSCDVNPKTGVGILRFGLASGGNIHFEIPRGGAESMMQVIRKRLAIVPPALRKADEEGANLANLPETSRN